MGRDATEVVRETHNDWEETMKRHDALRIGRIVEERPRGSDIKGDEIALHGQVFQITCQSPLLLRCLACSKLTIQLAPKVQDETLFNDLQAYVGTDATEVAREEDVSDPLGKLLLRDDLIIAKFAPAARRQITLAQLQKRSHIPRKAERVATPAADDNDWRVWVAVAETPGSRKKLVYDATSKF